VVTLRTPSWFDSRSVDSRGERRRTVKNPWDQLVDAAGRIPLGGRRPELRPALCRQAAWLAADRVGHADGPIPAFDPINVRGRIRWELLVDTRRAAQQLVRAFSETLEVDLSASPLPRMSIDDDRATAPGRRNYLAPADVAALPMGVWVEAGPYTAIEWAARGMPDAVGRAGFMRVSDTGYLGVYETSEGARWRIESTRPASGRRGLLDEGEASTFLAAQHAVGAVVADRYPTLAASVLPPAAGQSPNRVFDRGNSDWRPLTLGPRFGGRWSARRGGSRRPPWCERALRAPPRRSTTHPVPQDRQVRAVSARRGERLGGAMQGGRAALTGVSAVPHSAVDAQWRWRLRGPDPRRP
jgi:hypothetical protein